MLNCHMFVQYELSFVFIQIPVYILLFPNILMNPPNYPIDDIWKLF